MALTERQAQDLGDALLNAFPDEAALIYLMQSGLDEQVDGLIIDQDPRQIVDQLIAKADAGGWLPRLLVAAREANSNNPELIGVVQQLGLPAFSRSEYGLQQMVDSASPFYDLATRPRQVRIEWRICRIEIGAHARGTGFLVAPDIVMTNYHVVESVIAGERVKAEGGVPLVTAADVELRFDYRVMDDGTVNTGVTYRLASGNKWLIDKSPYNPAEEMLGKPGLEPGPEELDYALLRVEGTPGNSTVGGGGGPDAPMRGWIQPPEGAIDLRPRSKFTVVQHPLGLPLKWADHVVDSFNATGTRITYKTSTARGSSGSPCFNANLELVALHHHGGPKVNQGIPITKIRERLQKCGIWPMLQVPLPSDARGETPKVMPTPAGVPVRDRVFVSYSREDVKWWKELQNVLAPYIRNGSIRLWDAPEPGDDRRKKIEEAWAATKVAVLLVTQNYLSEEFTAQTELPELLKAANEKGVRILWVPISYSAYEETDIAKYEPVHTPDQPLARLSVPNRNQALVKIANEIREAFRK